MKNSAPVILIDGSSYLYRAFFACPPLTNTQGEPTGAIFGVINMIRSLLNQYQPSHIAVVFDAKGGSFRNQLYPQYKATREAMPDDLKVQIEPIHTIIKAMGLPILCIDGVEADDVIGTLAVEIDKAGGKVLISTGDKDMAQLVNANITLINTMNNAVLTPEKVVDKFGVPPELIIDYLALMGDKSDNIPGVPGVGEKTAGALLNALPGIKTIYANLDQVASLSIRGAKSLKQKLEDYQQDALLSYQLATIKTDVALDFSAEKLRPQTPDTQQLVDLFNHYGFNRWLLELQADKFFNKPANNVSTPSVTKPAENSDPQPMLASDFVTVADGYETILTEAELDRWLKRLQAANLIAFDTETTSLDHHQAELIGLSFAVEAGQAAYIPLNHHYLDAPEQLPLELVLNKLKPILEDPKIQKVGQNIKYDYSVLANYGIEVQGITFDTMLESYILNSNGRHDMDSMALRYLKHKTTTYNDITKSGNKQQPLQAVSIDLVSHYAAEDADVTLQLHQHLWPQLAQQPQLSEIFKQIEMPLVTVLANMERTGVMIDTEQLQDYSTELAQQLQQLEQTMHNLAGETFNPNSPKQLQKILFEQLQLPVLKKTPKGDPSTNEEVLSELANDYELPKLILEYRSLAKLKNTYTDKLPLMLSAKDQRIHTNYNQTGTVTGRLSSSDPNLQNIPVRNEQGRKIRQAFITEPNYRIVSADYSQIELRIMAHLSQDEGLLQAFTEDRDIHRVTAAETLGITESDVSTTQRRNAKAVNFGLIYGMSAFGLAKQLGISRSEAQYYVDRYFERYPGIKNYMERTRALAIEQGYVETVAGRRLYLPGLKSNRAMERKGAERAAINAPMQGTAADIIKTAMLQIASWIKQQPTDTIRMLMQVHDELVFEIAASKVDQYIPQIRQIMENCYQLSVPLKVDIGIGENWDQAH